jgi:hypothetical protein
MDLGLIGKLLARASKSLGLDEPLRPWWLGETKRCRPPWRSPWLAAPCPSPYDLDPALLFAAFSPKDHKSIARQIDRGYAHLVVVSEDFEEPVNEHAYVRVEMGLPLIGRDRVLVRICTRNHYARTNIVTGDFHAWLGLDGKVKKTLEPSQLDLASAWPRWIVGRSPGLDAEPV